MSSDAYTPSTSIISPPINGLPRTYLSEREKAPETPLPARGSVLGLRFGAPYKDHIVIDAVEVPRGGRKFEQITHCEFPCPVMNGSRYFRELNCAVAYTEQIVLISDYGTGDPNTTYSPINEFLCLKRTETPPVAALEAFYETYRSSAIMDLPSVLQSISVVWHEDIGEGESETEWKGLATGRSRSLSGNESNSAQSTAALIPSLVPVIKNFTKSRLPTTSHFFYLPLPITTEDILGKVSAISDWPVFQPEELTFTLKGSKVSIQASASASAAFSTGDNGATGSVDLTKGKGSSFDVSPVQITETIRATLHGSFSLDDATHDDIEITATANAGWTGDKGTTLEEATTTPAWSSVAGMPSVTSEKEVTATISGSVSPTSVNATNWVTVPITGVYLIDSKPDPIDWGWVRVYAETFDASVLA